MDNELATIPEIPPGSALESRQVSITSIEDIHSQIKRAEVMGEALDKIRALAVKRTVPSDWIAMGQNLYLEGDGALRIAPMIGLQLSNVRKSVEVVEGGTVRVTITADASSGLFGTRFAGVSRTRTSADAFLTQNGKKDRADLEDVESAAYKGMVARAVQLLCGLSGLTPEEARTRFGLSLDGSNAVAFKGGQSEAKREDALAAADGIKEVHRIILKLSDGNPTLAGDILEKLTANPDKGWPGKRDPNKLTEAGVKFALRELKKRESEFDSISQG